jgi:uncharacterized damage-inducible protein DinB
MDARVAALAQILRLNTRLLRNCLDGISDEQAVLRPSASTNSVAFVASHVAEARFYMLAVLGAEQSSPLSAYLAGARGVDDITRLPPMEDVQRAWTAAAHALRARLDSVTPAELDARIDLPFPLPVAEPTGLGLLAFFVQHESYHIGQLALLRKYLGLPAMQYT